MASPTVVALLLIADALVCTVAALRIIAALGW